MMSCFSLSAFRILSLTLSFDSLTVGLIVGLRVYPTWKLLTCLDLCMFMSFPQISEMFGRCFFKFIFKTVVSKSWSSKSSACIPLGTISGN